MASTLFRKKSIATILRDAESGAGDSEHFSLKRVLGVRDLTFFGVAAVIGAGIFSSIGQACYDGGPGVIYLYIFTAVACGFAALCYAEFASTVPVSGSAYTYSYVAFGEIFAWIIGWDLLMEYAIGNIAVAISWSDYFTGLLDKAGMHIPRWLTMDYTTAHKGFIEASNAAGAALDPAVVERASAWSTAPMPTPRSRPCTAKRTGPPRSTRPTTTPIRSRARFGRSGCARPRSSTSSTSAAPCASPRPGMSPARRT